MYLICLAQALDLRGVALKGKASLGLMSTVREIVPFVSGDRPLGDLIEKLNIELKRLAGKG